MTGSTKSDAANTSATRQQNKVSIPGLVEERDNVRKRERHQDEPGHYPEHDFVDVVRLRQRAYLTGCAVLGHGHAVDPAPGEPHENQRRTDKDRSIGFEHPCAADAQCDQHQRAEATDRRGECRQRSADKRRFLSCGFRHLCAPNRSRRAYSNARTIVRSQAPEGGSMEASLTIGRLAESAQGNAETVRYY